MHGVTRHITFPAKMVLSPRIIGSNNANVAFTAELRLSRKDFGIARENKYNPSYNPVTNRLADSLDVLLELSANREGYSNRALGGGTPPGVSDTISRVLRARGVDAAISTYRQLPAASAGALRFGAEQLDVIGHQLAEQHQLRDAVAILAFNAQEYGGTPGVLESLGEAQAFSNDAPGALETYRKALARFPSSSSAREMVRQLERVNAGQRR